MTEPAKKEESTRSTIGSLLCLMSPICAFTEAGGTITLTAATRAYGPTSPLENGARLLAAIAVVTIAARYARDFRPRVD